MIIFVCIIAYKYPLRRCLWNYFFYRHGLILSGSDLCSRFGSWNFFHSSVPFYVFFFILQISNTNKEGILTAIENVPSTDGFRLCEDEFRVPTPPVARADKAKSPPSFIIMGDEFPLLDPSMACQEFELEWNQLTEFNCNFN